MHGPEAGRSEPDASFCTLAGAAPSGVASSTKRNGGPVRHTLRIATGVLLAATVLTGCTSGSSPDSEGRGASAAPTGSPSGAHPAQPGTPAGEPDVGVQLFQWTWDAIAQECTDVLGPAGYAWVLTSPPQEHIVGPEWWTAYQPVSYRVESRLGTREEFAAMVSSCEDAGVAVLADAVINHMTGQDAAGTGSAGSTYEHFEYPGLYSDADGDFHHCGLTPTDDIQQYTDAAQVQTCELLNLADLATETEHVRQTVVAYLEDLLSLGVAGFRIDAAKHMAAADVAAIVAQLPEGTRILQEVIGAAGEPIQPEDYLPSGQVFDFAYGRELASYVGGGTVRKVPDLGTGAGALPSDQAVVFVQNHDTERNGSTLSYKDGADDVLATVLMLAGSYGTPVVHSGYAFRERDTGPVQDADGAVRDAECAPASEPDADVEPGDWLCQHRWPAVAGMVGWRLAVGDAPQTVWSERRVLTLDRDGRGFLAVNAGRSPVEQTFTTTLPPGEYCDVLSGAPAGESDPACSSGAVEVGQDGTVTVTVPSDGAVALHVGARPGA